MQMIDDAAMLHLSEVDSLHIRLGEIKLEIIEQYRMLNHKIDRYRTLY